MILAQDYWQEVPTPSGLDISCMDIDQTGTIYFAADGDIYKSETLGETWELLLETDYRIYKIVKSESGNLFLAASSRVLMFDEASNELSIIYYYQNNFLSLIESSDNYIYAGNWGHIVRCDNDGTNCIGVLTVSSVAPVYCLSEHNGVIYAGITSYMPWIYSGGLWRTYNNGTTWEYTGLSENSIYAINFTPDGEMLASANGKRLKVSSDDGETWETHSCYTGYNQDGEWGDWWFKVNSIFVYNDHIFVGCGDDNSQFNGVLRKDNNWDDWHPLITGISNNYICEIKHDSNGYLYSLASEHDEESSCIYRSSQTVLSNEKDDAFIDSPMITYNYPNPFNPITTIVYDTPKESNINLTIFDLTGRKIIELVNERSSPGTHKVTWDASDEPSGIYFARLTSEDYSTTNKLILLK